MDAERLILRALACLIGACCLASCGTFLRWHEDRYVVKEGENLYSIAMKVDVAWTDLAAWNGLGDGELIFPGQTLRLTRPDSAPPAPPRKRGQIRANRDWIWPVAGPVITKFGDAGRGGKGIDISGNPGDPVFAAAGGKVVYSGSGLVGYGRLVIVKHDEHVLSAYGYNRELLVDEGDQVKTGQRIASVGFGPGRRPMTHFEIRLDGKPVNPLLHLPTRD